MQSDDFLSQLPKADEPASAPNGTKKPSKRRKKPVKKASKKRKSASPKRPAKSKIRSFTPAPVVERKTRTIKVDLGLLQTAMRGLDKRSTSKVHQVLGALTGTSKKMRGRVLQAVAQIVS